MSRTDLPSEKASNFQARLRETVQTLLGTRGDKLDRALTLRDMIESKLFELRPGAVVGPGVAPLQPGAAWPDNTPPPYVPDLTPPPSPDSLTATPAISHVMIEVPPATYLQGHGHLRTHIYGANPTPSNPSPTFSDAVEVGQFEGTIWAMASDPAVTWHLWAKWESRDNELSASPAGGTNGVVATTAQDPERLVAALTGPGKPFSVVTVPYTLEDGTPVPAGTYTSQAFMGSFVAQRGQIALLAVDDARIANLSAAKLTAGSIAVGQYAQSTGYIAGSAGWRINGDGTAEFSGVIVRGTVYATAGQIGGITIAANAVRAGQTAYNTGSGFHLGSDGRLSLGNSAGNSLTWDGSSLSVKGTINGSTINGSTMNSGALNLQGDGGNGWGYARSLNKWWNDGGNGWVFARQGSDGGTFAEMKGGNQRIWMSSWGDCGIQFPGITMTHGGLTINQANVINTLNLAGNAVTVPSGVTMEVDVGVNAEEVLLAFWIDAGGQPIWVCATGSAPERSSGGSSGSTYTMYANTRIYVDGAMLVNSKEAGGFAISRMISGGGSRYIELRAARAVTSGLPGFETATVRAGTTLFAIGCKR